MEFPVTVESQEAFDELVKDRLGREKTKRDDLEKQIQTLTAEKQALEAKSSDNTAEIDAAKAEVTTELTEAFRKQLRAAEVRAVAAGLQFNDPMDALAAIGDLSDVEVGDDYKVDATAIKTRLGEIAEKKPYLIAQTEDFSFEKDGGLGKKGANDPFSGKSGVDLLASAFDAKTDK